MGLVRFALNNRHAISVLAIAVVVLGGVAMWQIPVDILPIFRAPAVQVMTFYSGMPAGVVEKNITNRLERWTGQASGTVLQESKSMVGVSIIRSYFSDDTDPNTALTQVNSLALSNLRYLPPGTLPSIVMPFDPSATMPVCILGVASPTLGEGELQDIGRYELRSGIQSVQGAVAPAVFGGKTRAVMAYVDRDKIESRGMSPVDVVDAIGESNIMLPTGGARIGDIDYQIDSDSMYESPAAMGYVPLKTKSGNASFLRDVGSVEDASRIQTGTVRINGKRQVYVPVYRQQGASTLSVVEGVKAAVPTMKERIPEGIDLQVVMDQSVYVRSAIESLLHEGVLGSILAAFMILVFLGSVRTTIIAVTCIPLSVLACIACLLATGNTINAMTLGGLALAIGPLVDNAIVVLENTHRHLGMGKSAQLGAQEGAGEVALPVLVATLTTIIVLMPVAFTPGMGKFLFRPLAMSVAFAMLASYLLSLTLVPVWCSIWLKGHADHGHGRKKSLIERLHAPVEAVLDVAVRIYTRLLQWVLRHRAKTVIFVCTCFIGALCLGPRLGQELFPVVDAGQLVLTVRLPTGTRLETSERSIVGIEQEIRDAIPAGDLNMIISELGVVPDWSAAYTPNTGPQDTVIKVQLTEHRHESAQHYASILRQRLNEKFPGIEFAFNTGGIVSAALNYGALSPINVQIAGKKTDAARDLASRVAEVTRKIPGAVDVRVVERFDYPQLFIVVDRAKAADLGLSQQDVIRNVVTCLNSSIQFARNFWIDPVSGNQYWVGVQYREEAVDSIDSLLNVPITSPNSERTVLLRNIATISRKSAPAEIVHRNYSPVVEVMANVQDRDVGSVAIEIEQALKKLEVPAGLSVNMSGEVQQMRSSFGSMGFGLLMATILVYLLLVALFRSYLDPVIILTVVPLGLTGVLVTLYLTGTALNVQSSMGIIFMVGIVVANSVLLVDFANRLLEEGITVTEAITSAGSLRLRPILMTFLATFISLLPMAIGFGKGSEANVPLGRAVLGGLVAGTILTLFVVPIFYTWLRRTPHPLPEPAMGSAPIGH
jgi:multidrug efflux pump subunit AcrB